MQRTVKDHTSCMTRVRTKCEIDGEISGNWSASAWDTLKLLHNIRMWGLQGTDRAVTTYRLPLNRGIPSYPKVLVYPSTMPMYKETTHIPLGLRPYGSTSKNMGKPEGMTNHHPDPSSTSTHTNHMND